MAGVPDGLRKLLWFAILWIGGVAAVTVLAMIIRAFLV
jgi:hypothetical protein